MPSPQDDKKEFSLRLKQALKRSPKKINTPTELEVEFNLRHKGDSISQQAAQKWMSGLARPTPDKIETLAEWLNVSARWLRYGFAEDRPAPIAERKHQPKKSVPAIQPTEDELKLLARLRSLGEHRRNLVIEILEQFSLEQEMWSDYSRDN
ncbi:helix-turn-helix domain-containing protein [Collimonas fungivorans]|uniref:helix-turn-helix domain-containing protein n=1 Tax=Collimonas fungivorans TaxID=158899 RepID=UPI0007782800|nr:helix-turn-helix domain-containing protein [Collimonas fungivorans]